MIDKVIKVFLKKLYYKIYGYVFSNKILDILPENVFCVDKIGIDIMNVSTYPIQSMSRTKLFTLQYIKHFLCGIQTDSFALKNSHQLVLSFQINTKIAKLR